MTQTAKLLPDDGGTLDSFGSSVALNDSVAVVGAFWDDDNGVNSGSAYRFEKPPGGWNDMTQTTKLLPSDGEAEDLFGYSVGVSDTDILVGASRFDSEVTNSGAVYVFVPEPCGLTLLSLVAVVFTVFVWQRRGR